MTARVDWTAFGGIAQLIAALATLVLAGVTAYMAVKTRDVAKETKAESGATKALAEEAKKDRELAWRPHLTLIAFGFGGSTASGFRGTVEIANTGGGPAIGIRVVARLPSDVAVWWLIRAGDLAPLQNRERSESNDSVNPPPNHLFVPPMSAEDQSHTCEVVMFCTDALNRRHRFPVLRIGDDELRAYPVETWAPGLGPAPSWASQPGLWSI